MTAVELVLARIPREEGRMFFPYDDATGQRVRAPKGKITWGDGFNLEECGSSALFEIMDRYLLGQEEIPLLKLPWYVALDPVRQSVCLDIAYNGGEQGFLLGFPHMIAALARQDWPTAATECHVEDPKLAARYAALAQLLLIGGVT